MGQSDEGVQQNYKRRTLVGPWKNIAEFHKVYDLLFADNANATTHRRALSQMRVWNLRRSLLCPAAVMATITILEVRLKDVESDAIVAANLQILYASAFTRFFNFMSSIMQAHNMRTMYETAQQLGLQSFVVDLRHICAHGQVLPPLDVLRNTAKYCLQWLHEYYWNAQRLSMCDVDASRIRRKDKTQFDDNITEMLGMYDAALECYMKGATNIKTSKRHLHGKRFAQLKQYVEQRKLQNLREVFDAVVKDLTALVKREASIKDLVEIYLEALLKMKYFYAVADLCIAREQLTKLIDATQSLFRMLAVYGLIEDYFYNLLDIAENATIDNVRRAGSSFWATQIVAGFVGFRKCKQMYKIALDENSSAKEFDSSTLNFEKIPKKLRQVLNNAGIDPEITLIFGDSLRRPWIWVFDHSFLEQHLDNLNEYTAPVLKSLLPLLEPALTNKKKQAFKELIDALFESSSKPKRSKTDNSDTIYTANDLLQFLRASDAVTMDLEVGERASVKQTELQYGNWCLMPDDETHNWTTCPLGRLPWQ